MAPGDSIRLHYGSNAAVKAATLVEAPQGSIVLIKPSQLPGATYTVEQTPFKAYLEPGRSYEITVIPPAGDSHKETIIPEKREIRSKAGGAAAPRDADTNRDQE